MHSYILYNNGILKKIYETTIKFIVNSIICLLHVFIPDVNSFNNKTNKNLNF